MFRRLRGADRQCAQHTSFVAPFRGIVDALRPGPAQSKLFVLELLVPYRTQCRRIQRFNIFPIPPGSHCTYSRTDAPGADEEFSAAITQNRTEKLRRRRSALGARWADPALYAACRRPEPRIRRTRLEGVCAAPPHFLTALSTEK